MQEFSPNGGKVSREFLNMLGQSTGEYYLFVDCREQTVCFSENILEVRELFCLENTVSTLEDWRRRMDPRDGERFSELFAALLGGERDAFDFSYRSGSGRRQNRWVHVWGKCSRDQNGRPDSILGRLSCMGRGREETALPAFRSRDLKKEVSRLLKDAVPGYLLLVGVDNLKSINLKSGRDFGDALLKTVARVLGEEAPEGARIFRVNGDWFAVNLPGTDEPAVEALFERLRERLEGRCTLSGGCVSFVDYHVPDVDTLLQYAESSLESAKANGKNRLSFFSPEDYEQKLKAMELREDLQRSVEHDFSGFTVCYQVQVRSESYHVYGAEALLRYTAPLRGEVPPSEFVPVLEQTGLVYPVGLWVMERALEQCRQWRSVLPEFHIGVNMSYRQLRDASIEQDVLELVRQSGLPGSALTIEITESMQLLDYPHLNRIFHSWKDHGIEISVDDFGTGYSSLHRLQEMEIDEIKIDRCFVSSIEKSAYNYRLLSNMIELADSCNIRVCCEGAETQTELRVLEDLHPSLLQGFLFSGPCTPEEFAARFVQPGPVFIPQEPMKIQESLPKTGVLLPGEEEIARTILEAENDIFYLSDMDTYEMYYLNPAGQKLFGVRDYRGRKCYKVLHGVDTPCDFCTNACLRQDSFHIWENQNTYCGRRFLLKDKLVNYMGKQVRLEVALDITKQEYLSPTAKERLTFADKIAGYMHALAHHADYGEAVYQALSSVGEFYLADRAYFFEPSGRQDGSWNNTFEWCAPNVLPQQESLQEVPEEVVRRWMERFETDQSVIIYNLAPLQESAPLEWEILRRQGIQRLIAVPIRDGGETIGFIGVDNPRYSIRDDTQVRVLASFLLARIRQDRNEHRYQALLRSANQDLLWSLGVGFWTLQVWKTEQRREMIADDFMRRQLGIRETAGLEACSTYWYNGITEEDRGRVEDALREMEETGKTVQTEFAWNHPQRGRIRLRFSGMLLEKTKTSCTLKGYCRILDSFCLAEKSVDATSADT